MGIGGRDFGYFEGHSERETVCERKIEDVCEIFMPVVLYVHKARAPNLRPRKKMV